MVRNFKKLTKKKHAKRNRNELIEFLDLFAGLSIRLPSRSRVYHVIENINIYKYYMEHLNDEDPEKVTAQHFNITRQYVNSIIERVKENIPADDSNMLK